MKYVIYTRVSTEDQAKSGLGLDAQRNACLQYIERNGGGEWLEFCDEAVSGALRMEDREELTNALAALEKGDILLIARRDRLGRDVIHNAIIEREIIKKKAKIISVSQDNEFMDAGMSQLMKTVLDAFAQYERYEIRRRTKLALHEKKKQGKRVGYIPYGYRLRDETYLERNPDEQIIVEKMVKWKDLGHSLREIAEHLNQEGNLNREKGEWSHVSIYKILKNRSRHTSVC